ncbi:MAG: diguanylate cyclase [Gammaproteobacteria bacterium]
MPTQTTLRKLAVAIGLLAAVMLPEGPGFAYGADLSRKPSQLTVRHWTKADGVPAEFVWNLYQSESGYLWLATDTGIARFDGQSFRIFGVGTHSAFRSNDIRELTGGANDSIWAASVGGGLLHIQGEEITRLDRQDGLASDAVYSVLVAANGDVWAGTASGACRLRDGAFRCWGPDDGLVGDRIARIAEDQQHRIWFSSVTDGVSVLDGERMRTFGRGEGFNDPGSTVLLPHPDLNMLIGTFAGRYYSATPERIVPLEWPMPPSDLKPFNAMRDRDGNTMVSMLGSIWQVQPALRRLDNPDGDIGYVTDLLEDRDGQLWAATSTGLYQYSAGAFTPYGEQEGVANQTFVVESGGDGSVWTGTEASGVFQVLADGQVRQFTVENGLPMNAVSSIMVEDQGVWIGTFGGGLVMMQNDEVVSTFTTDDGLAGNQVGSLYRDRAGDLWVGTDAGLNRLSEGKVTASLNVGDGLLADLVRDVREDATGRLLLSGDNGITIISPATLKIIDRIDRSKGLDNQTISTTHVDERGVIWIGGRSGGLMRMEGQTLFQFNADHNVRQTSVMTIKEDAHGYFWLGGRDGITRIARADLDEVALGARAQVRARSFSSKDGLRTTRVSGGYQSAATFTGDGRLWFATTSGLAVIDPARLSAGRAPQPASIEAVRADGVTITLSVRGKYRIPAGTDSVQIDYAVPSLNAADELRFYYRLGEGRWQPADQRRTAFFNALPLRDSGFQVAAAWDGDVFNADGAGSTQIALYVEPLWHQTYLARALALIAFMLILWFGQRMTLRYHRRRQMHLERLVDKRTAALQDALSEVRALSRIDALTGVANRRHFKERLAQIWSAAVRKEYPVGVMMIDIDHFKKFNDTAGHQAGDRCLTLVAQTLQRTVRTEDFVARYGGEEFAVVLTGNDVNHMWLIAGRLQAAVRKLALPHPGLPDGAIVTMSAGFAAAEPATGDNPEQLIRRADEALYRAKEEGRDRVVKDLSRGDGAALAAV